MTDEATRRRALQIAAGVAAVSAISTTTATAAPDVVGVWKLVAATTTDPSGKQVAVPYGPRGMGIV